jgi:CopG family nickel-responsive transcriptional regulator
MKRSTSQRLTRTCISLEGDLLARFDRQAARDGFATRSEAVKALVRRSLVEQEWKSNDSVAGAVALLYDHHRGGIARSLMGIQHDFASVVVATQHVHLDHDNCLEIVVVRGRAAHIRKLVARLKSVKGLKHSALLATSVGKKLA